MREIAVGLWEHVPERDKDYIAAPKANGYRSLHSTLRVPSLVVEASTLTLLADENALPVRSFTGCILNVWVPCCLQVDADGKSGVTFDNGLGPGVSAAEAALPLELQIRTESACRA